MNEFTINQRCLYSGMIVTIRSLRTGDGRYIVEDESHAFFPAAENLLTHLGMKREHEDKAIPFEVVASRAAMSAKGKVK